MRQYLLMMGTAATLLAGCSTDLEINAPYKESTVVYALFNMREDTHFVKINKAFLGEGDALQFAQVRDSSEYSAEDIEYAKVVRIQNGQEVATFDLQRITLNGREPGTFYGPSQTLYYFVGTAQNLPVNPPIQVFLDPASSYEVRLKVKGKDISARTVVVNDFTIATPDQSGTPARFIASGGGGYNNYELNWNSSVNSRRFQVSWRFNYDEVRGSDTTSRSFTQAWGTKDVTSTGPSQEFALLLNGETFYRTISERVPNDPTVDRRIFKGIDFLFTVADREFFTFLSLQSPISSIVEDRPVYSNVNGGLGLVASRYTKSVLNKWIDPNSLNELRNGIYTGQLNFCAAADPGGVPTCD